MKKVLSVAFSLLVITSCNTDQQTPTPNPSKPEPKPPVTEPIDPNLPALKIKDGFTDKQSYFPGEQAFIFFDAVEKTSESKLQVTDLEGKVIFYKNLKEVLPQGNVIRSASKGFDYKNPEALSIPKNLESGVYLINEKIPLIIKSKDKNLPVYVIETNTFNAYNCAGGFNSYGHCNKQKEPSPLLSFRRPMKFEMDYKSPRNIINSPAFTHWLLKNNYKFNYVADIDVDDPNLLKDVPYVVIQGHSEYWTRKARENFDRYIDGGGHAAQMSGNTMWWQVRYTEDKNTMIAYKYKYKEEKVDDLKDHTIGWYESSLKYPIQKSIGADFILGGYADPKYSTYGINILSPKNPVFANMCVRKKDIIRFSPLPKEKMGVIEYDGAPVEITEGIPYLKDQGHHKQVLFAYDYGFRNKLTTGTFFAFQKTPKSGVIISIPTTAWGYALWNSLEKEKYATITKNIFNILKNNPTSVFGKAAYSQKSCNTDSP